MEQENEKKLKASNSQDDKIRDELNKRSKEILKMYENLNNKEEE
jgi:hypothetical protein